MEINFWLLYWVALICGYVWVIFLPARINRRYDLGLNWIFPLCFVGLFIPPLWIALLVFVGSQRPDREFMVVKPRPASPALAAKSPGWVPYWQRADYDPTSDQSSKKR